MCLKEVAFVTDKGYFFNNLGYDRYGGRLDLEYNYFRVPAAEITNREKVQPPPRKEVKAKEYIYSFPEDMENEVVFDQPYKYNFMPKGGQIDDNDFQIFENGGRD